MLQEDLEEAMRVAFAPDFVDEDEAEVDVVLPQKHKLNRYKRKMLEKVIKEKKLKAGNKLYYMTKNGTIVKYRVSKKNERKTANKMIRRASIDDTSFMGKGSTYKKAHSSLINDLPLAHFSYK